MLRLFSTVFHAAGVVSTALAVGDSGGAFIAGRRRRRFGERVYCLMVHDAPLKFGACTSLKAHNPNDARVDFWCDAPKIMCTRLPRMAHAARLC